MRSRFRFRSQSIGAHWSEPWSFSGADERALRDCLDQVGDFLTAAPAEHHELSEGPRRDRRDGSLAMVLYAVEAEALRRHWSDPFRADAAWTAEGAIKLAEILPERLDDLRRDILKHFA